jgi:2-dehydro-3-deoxyphosphogluconate aldolase/(4S)-4-hydroxy-2-oxoglutarate aldolase
MSEVLEKIARHAVVPALVLEDAEKAESLGHALIDGGLPVVEVTLRTPTALKSLQTMAQIPDLLVGAGTVLNIAQAQQAVDAGAKFIVSPGMNAQLINWCQDQKVLVLPGAVTATEIMLAINLELSCVKFFPCLAMGGLPVLRALQGPFPTMRFMPTGGITRANMTDYLSFPPVLAVGGTWMVRKEWLEGDRFDIIADACAETVKGVEDVRRGKVKVQPKQAEGGE